ncbi:unnamed protein product, partial [Brenthis ino]
MWTNIVLFLCFFSISCTRKEFSPIENRNDEDDISIENEYDSRNNNVSWHTTTAGYTTKGEIAVEKFVDTMMASEKYLKMIETVENRLSHLESVFLVRTNTILKYMTEVLRVIKTSPVDILENALQSLKTDLDKLKRLISQQMNESPNLRGR